MTARRTVGCWPSCFVRCRLSQPPKARRTCTDITLATGDRARFDVKMTVGAVTETAVAAESPLLQAQSATVGSLVTEKAVQDLPVAGRNITPLVQLVPGAFEGVANSLASGTRPDERRRRGQHHHQSRDQRIRGIRLRIRAQRSLRRAQLLRHQAASRFAAAAAGGGLQRHQHTQLRASEFELGTAGFGSITNTANNIPRQMQFAVKVLF